jgi:GT2 family glycosyltransferase
MQIENPRASIIILTYNGEKYIDALLESLSDQSYPKELIEIIVIDNSSNDKTVSIVQKNHPNIKCVRMRENLGFACGNNKALDYAKHEFLVFLNQDTVCHKDWLKALIDGIFVDKKVAVCTSNIIPPEANEFQELDRESLINTLYYCDLSPYGYGRYNKRRNTPFIFTKILSGCSFIIRRQTVIELGYLFDEKLWMYNEDTDLSLRIQNMGKRISVARDSVVYHFHNSNFQLNAKNMSLSARAIMNRVYAFYKNMSMLEFCLFFPLLLFGSIYKIFEFRLTSFQKIIYFVPFSVFSTGCILLALAGLADFSKKKREILKNRRVMNLPILKLVLKCNF